MSNTHLDDRVFRELRAKIGKLAEEAHVRVGVLAEDKHGEEGVSMVELAAIHEFGSPSRNIPERSFIRSTFHSRREDLQRILVRLARAIVGDRMEPREALGILGLWAATAVKKQITGRLVVPRLEETDAGRRTIRRKGSDVTLVDTALLVNAITWQIGEGE